jgi:hypothetical protein
MPPGQLCSDEASTEHPAALGVHYASAARPNAGEIAVVLARWRGRPGGGEARGGGGGLAVARRALNRAIWDSAGNVSRKRHLVRGKSVLRDGAPNRCRVLGGRPRLHRVSRLVRERSYRPLIGECSPGQPARCRDARLVTPPGSSPAQALRLSVRVRARQALQARACPPIRGTHDPGPDSQRGQVWVPAFA